ncbi:MAG TPA: 50S ribosomal protein L24 [Bacillota bacterium]|jgi:large subunit ribosomal protein L24|nr:50S ribosomal protein L24 [Bacillota bacterium]HOL08973.1 50S ribosomal protein L24 [Bacillota bacterium]HPO96473.1 50S ribosomal protein L24 [Bacillota bacterium]
MGKLSIKKGDQVVVIAGKQRGKKGKVQKVHPADNTVLVEGLNLVKKHSKPSQTNPQGGVIDKSLPINVSKVMLICPECNEPIRVARKRTEDGVVRVCRKCSRNID